jgi:hypothetical protein
MKKINVIHLVSCLLAWKNCIKSDNKEWKDKWEDEIEAMEALLPSVSGIDSGMKFDRENSTETKLIFTFSFRHMDEHGSYDGWTDHQLIIKPIFNHNGMELRITGKDRNDTKDYLYYLFYEIFEIDYDREPGLPYSKAKNEQIAYNQFNKEHKIIEEKDGEIIAIKRGRDGRVIKVGDDTLSGGKILTIKKDENAASGMMAEIGRPGNCTAISSIAFADEEEFYSDNYADR